MLYIRMHADWREFCCKMEVMMPTNGRYFDRSIRTESVSYSLARVIFLESRVFIARCVLERNGETRPIAVRHTFYQWTRKLRQTNTIPLL